MKPSVTHLWQLPSNGLIHKDGSWCASAERSLGAAWGLLAPVRAAAEGGWEIAAAADSLLDLYRVPADAPRALQPPAQADRATHYLCLLRYDHPGDRPGASFSTHFLLARQFEQKAYAEAKAPEDKATVGELEAALHSLQRHYGRDLQRQMVSADDGEEEAPRSPSDRAAAADSTARPQAFCFAFASCQYPAGMMDRLQANASHQALAERFPGGRQLPTRLLLLGDQVYTDATYGLLDPVRLDDRYRAPYEELTARDGPMGQLPQDFQRVIRMTPDDHEFADDWEPGRNLAADQKYDRGLRAYWRYQRGETQPQAPLWMKEPRNGASPGWRLFMADTRTTREFRNDQTLQTATILGDAQTRDLEQWLTAAPADDLKIVTSPAMLLPRSRKYLDDPLHLDNWQGYPASFHPLLALLCDRQLRNVVFLSGDAHLACSARVTVKNLGTDSSVHFESHHAPALYAPYPFANETRWNLLLEDRFVFTLGSGPQAHRYECTVDAEILADGASGCGLLHAERTPGGWDLSVEVLRAAQEMRTPCSAAM
jgi:hypothetical protein